MIDWSAFRELVARGRRFVLTSHMRPDCDALGSELGMAAVLTALGKDVRIVNGDTVPPHLKFIDPAGRIETLGETKSPIELTATDVLLVLDTSAWVQLGPMAEVVRTTQAQKAVVDHHVSEDDLGAAVFKNVRAPACGLLIVQAADALGVELNAEIAVPLFAAVATDTGWFRFASVDADTYRAAGRLIDAGARPAELYSALYEHETLARLHLRGRILSQVASELNGRLIWSQVTLADFADTGATTTDTEEVINMLLRVAGAQAALLFVELAGGKVKASFRSNSAVNVREVAEQFGGGGHTMAAGATVAEPLASACEKILDAMRKAMR